MAKIEADPFDVWGKPPEWAFTGLTERQRDQLRKYIGRIGRSAYRLGHENGYGRGLEVAECAISRRRLRNNRE